MSHGGVRKVPKSVRYDLNDPLVFRSYSEQIVQCTVKPKSTTPEQRQPSMARTIALSSRFKNYQLPPVNNNH